MEIFDAASYVASPIAGLLLAVAALSLFTGAWVVASERGRQVSLSFLLTSVAVATYLFAFAFLVSSREPDLALTWARFMYLGVPFVVPAVYQFSVDLLGIRAQRRAVVRAAWLVGALYCVLSVGTDVLMTGVMLHAWGYFVDLTLWNLPILVWSGVLLALVIGDYSRAYREADAIQRARIRWFAIPLLIASVGFVDYAPGLGIPVWPLGFLSFPIFMASAAWAVGRYHLPDLTPAYAADQILATMADALLVCESRGRIVFANRGAGRLLACDQATIPGRELATLFPDDVASALLGGDVTERVTVLRALDGSAVDVSVSAGRIEASRHRPMGVVIVIHDIRARRQAAEALRRQEQRFRALIEHGRDTITILDAAGDIRYLSPSVEPILGYDADAEAGRDIRPHLHPGDVDRVMATLERLAERPGGTVETEVRLRHVDGGYRTFEVTVTNLLEHPAVGGFIVNGRDVTEARQLEAQLQQAQKMEAIGRLAGGVAHDFNNILTAIGGNADLMDDQMDPDSPLRAELGEVRRGAKRAARLTDELLAFSRRQVVQATMLDLNAVVDEMRSMLERLIAEDSRLVTELAPSLPPVRADRTHLEQVVLNLVVNARDAVRAGGTVVLRTDLADVDPETALASAYHMEPGSFVRLTVQDDGIGMDEETRARIFEPFFTTKPQGRGTGLGLSTVYGSVRQSGGFVAVESAPGRGSSFHVYLPRVDAAAEAPTDADAAAPREDANARGSETILVVEDEAPVRTLIRKVLQRRGYTVLEAEDGARAIEVSRGHDAHIDLLLADLVMPGMSGREAAEQIAGHRPGIRTVFISGYTADEVMRRGILDGEHAFLAKPFTPADLAARVRKALAEGIPAQATLRFQQAGPEL